MVTKSRFNHETKTLYVESWIGRYMCNENISFLSKKKWYIGFKPQNNSRFKFNMVLLKVHTSRCI
jgi:hypothetical protein